MTIYIYICMYSRNKLNFAKRIAHGKHYLKLQLFQGNQSWCPRRLSVWPFLLTAVPITVFLPETLCVSTPWTVFSTQARCSKPMFSTVVKMFWLKHFFSEYIFINFSLFAQLSQKNSMTDLFSSLFDLQPFWIISKQILFWDQKYLGCKQCRVNINGKKLWKKVLPFFQTLPIIN